MLLLSKIKYINKQLIDNNESSTCNNKKMWKAKFSLFGKEI